VYALLIVEQKWEVVETELVDRPRTLYATLKAVVVVPCAGWEGLVEVVVARTLSAPGRAAVFLFEAQVRIAVVESAAVLPATAQHIVASSQC
jgi:hypothetical protein